MKFHKVVCIARIVIKYNYRTMITKATIKRTGNNAAHPFTNQCASLLSLALKITGSSPGMKRMWIGGGGRVYRPGAGGGQWFGAPDASFKALRHC